MVVLLIAMKLLAWQPHRPVQRHRQSPVPAPEHDQTQHQFASHIPPAREAVGRVWKADTDPNGPVRGHHFKNDIENAIGDRVAQKVPGLDDADGENGEHEEPDIVRDLALDLLADETKAAFRIAFSRRRAHAVPGELVLNRAGNPGSFRLATPLSTRSGVVRAVLLETVPVTLAILWVCDWIWFIGVDTEAPLLVDIRVSHGDYHRIY